MTQLLDGINTYDLTNLYINQAIHPICLLLTTYSNFTNKTRFEQGMFSKAFTLYLGRGKELGGNETMGRIRERENRRKDLGTFLI